MATTIPTGSPLNLVIARKGVTSEAELSTFVSLLAGKGDDYAFPILDREGVGAGTTVTCRVQSVRDDTDFFGPNAQILGNENSLAFNEHQLSMQYFSCPYGIENVVFDEQITPISLRRQSMKAIAKKWRYRREQWVLNQLAGNLVADAAGGTWGSVKEYVGGNAITSHSGVGVDSGHIIRAGAEANDTDVGSDSSNIFTIDLVREAVKRAGSNVYTNQRFAMAPANTPWGDLYVCIIHGEQWGQLMTYSSTNEFTMIEQAKIQGGMDPSISAFIQGPGAIYDRTLILVSDFIPTGIDSSAAAPTTRRAVFFGAQAGHFLYGKGFTDGDHLGYSDHMVHRRWSAQADTVCGFKVTEIPDYSNQRWASFVITSYSAV